VAAVAVDKVGAVPEDLAGVAAVETIQTVYLNQGLLIPVVEVADKLMDLVIAEVEEVALL